LCKQLERGRHGGELKQRGKSSLWGSQGNSKVGLQEIMLISFSFFLQLYLTFCFFKNVENVFIHNAWFFIYCSPELLYQCNNSVTIVLPGPGAISARVMNLSLDWVRILESACRLDAVELCHWFPKVVSNKKTSKDTLQQRFHMLIE
jgi:hypothetical protein